MAEWQALGHAIRVRRNVRAFAEAATAPGVLGLQQVALPGVRAQHFAPRGDLKALGDRFLCLYPFWTSHNRFLKKSANIGTQWGLQGLFCRNSRLR